MIGRLLDSRYGSDRNLHIDPQVFHPGVDSEGTEFVGFLPTRNPLHRLLVNGDHRVGSDRSIRFQDEVFTCRCRGRCLVVRVGRGSCLFASAIDHRWAAHKAWGC